MSVTTGLRLNLGAGDDRRDGFVSVDLRPEIADVVADVGDLPYGDGEVDEVLALDILEHLPAARTAAVLGEWRRVLRPGGHLTLKVPNLEALARALLDASYPASVVVRNIYGGHRWGPDGAWDAHHTGWTPTMLAYDLATNGFHVLSNDHGLNMTIVAEAV